MYPTSFPGAYAGVGPKPADGPGNEVATYPVPEKIFQAVTYFPLPVNAILRKTGKSIESPVKNRFVTNAHEWGPGTSRKEIGREGRGNSAPP